MPNPAGVRLAPGRDADRSRGVLAARVGSAGSQGGECWQPGSGMPAGEALALPNLSFPVPIIRFSECADAEAGTMGADTRPGPRPDS